MVFMAMLSLSHSHSHSHGGEGPVPVEPQYFVLYPAEDAANPEQLPVYQQMAL